MAPRMLESKEAFFDRLRAAARKGAREVRFGGHHYSHAVCEEGGVWRLRALVLDRAKAEAFRKQHGMFMPENAEALSEPGPTILLEASSVEELIAKLSAKWPL